jgi:hypothetical protein
MIPTTKLMPAIFPWAAGRALLKCAAAVLPLMLALAMTMTAWAQRADHLEPEAGPTMNTRLAQDDNNEAMTALALRLHPLAPCGVIAQYAGTVSATQLYKDESGECYVESFTLGVGAEADTMSRCDKPLPAPLYDALAAVWRRELLKVRYEAEPQPLAVEGTTYHFYALAGQRTLFGLTQTVQGQNHRPAMENLTQIANLLCLYAQAEATAQATIVEELRQRVMIQAGGGGKK